VIGESIHGRQLRHKFRHYRRVEWSEHPPYVELREMVMIRSHRSKYRTVGIVRASSELKPDCRAIPSALAKILGEVLLPQGLSFQPSSSDVPPVEADGFQPGMDPTPATRNPWRLTHRTARTHVINVILGGEGSSPLSLAESI